MATPTRTFASPPYTGPSADALLTTAAGYHQDRESILDLAAAGGRSPDDLNSTAVARLCEAVETLDTLVVAADTERSADRRTIARLELDLAMSVEIRAAAAGEMSEARDQLLAQAYQIERLRIDLAIAEDLRIAALADADQQRLSAAKLAADNRALRTENAALAIAMLRGSLGIVVKSAEEVEHELAIERMHQREHARAVVTNAARHGAVCRRALVSLSYTADVEVVDAACIEAVA